MGDVVAQGLELISDEALLIILMLRLPLSSGCCLEPFVRGKRVSQKGPQLRHCVRYIRHLRSFSRPSTPQFSVE